MKKILVLFLLAAPLIISCTSSTTSQKKAEDEKGVKEYVMAVDVKKFEEDYAKVHGNELKKMAEDGNPGEFIVEDGRALFHKVDGSAGKSCASCHGENGAKNLKGISVSYPKYSASVNGVLTLPVQINMCRDKNMGVAKEKSWKYGKAEITAVELFVKSLSNGMPIKVKTDGPAKAFYEAGKKNFYGKLGEWNWNCAQCHVKYAGRYSRQELLPPAPLLADHWPSFRLDWGKEAGMHTRTIQDRFKGCIKNMRVSDDKIPDFETEYMRNLELYVMAQANGRSQHVPGFRR